MTSFKTWLEADEAGTQGLEAAVTEFVAASRPQREPA
jgi:hypothetical protein